MNDALRTNDFAIFDCSGQASENCTHSNVKRSFDEKTRHSWYCVVISRNFVRFITAQSRESLKSPVISSSSSSWLKAENSDESKLMGAVDLLPFEYFFFYTNLIYWGGQNQFSNLDTDHQVPYIMIFEF
jgi:hypothetical protein